MANKDEARQLYATENLSIPDIAEKLSLSAGTVYKYKADDEGSDNDWDRARRVCHMTPSDLVSIYMVALKDVLLKVDKDHQLLLQPGTADAITKSIKNIQRLNPGYQYLGVVIDFIRVTDNLLGAKDPSLQEKMRKHWPEVKQRLSEELEKSKGI